jgi:hypothetical protein
MILKIFSLKTSEKFSKKVGIFDSKTKHNIQKFDRNIGF